MVGLRVWLVQIYFRLCRPRFNATRGGDALGRGVVGRRPSRCRPATSCAASTSRAFAIAMTTTTVGDREPASMPGM